MIAPPSARMLQVLPHGRPETTEPIVLHDDRSAGSHDHTGEFPCNQSSRGTVSDESVRFKKAFEGEQVGIQCVVHESMIAGSGAESNSTFGSFPDLLWQAHSQDTACASTARSARKSSCSPISHAIHRMGISAVLSSTAVPARSVRRRWPRISRA
jgi:hypothetical protein